MDRPGRCIPNGQWYEITSHMTKMPVPEEFIGIRDYKEFKDGFEIIRR